MSLAVINSDCGIFEIDLGYFKATGLGDPHAVKIKQTEQHWILVIKTLSQNPVRAVNRRIDQLEQFAYLMPAEARKT